MHRVLALLLAFALLFQATWAMAATYCEHETAPKVAMHFGHHVHVHKAADGKQAGGKWAVDDDCAFCHAGHPALIAASFTCPLPDAPAPVACGPSSKGSSAPPEAPERPQWPRLA